MPHPRHSWSPTTPLPHPIFTEGLTSQPAHTRAPPLNLLRVNSLLHMRIHLDHLVVQIRVVPDHDLGIPRHGHKDGIDAAAERRGEDVADLQADQERKGADDDREVAVGIVRGLGELEVEEREQRGGEADEERAEREDGADQALVDEGVDAAVLDHLPGVLGRLDVWTAVQGDVRKGISVDELDDPRQTRDEAVENAREDKGDNVSLPCGIVLSRLGQHLEEVDDGHDQGPQADGAEAVRQGPPQGAPGDARRIGPGVVIPAAVDASNRRVDRVLDPLAEPEGRKGDERDQAGDGRVTARARGAGRVVAAGRPLGVDGDKGDREPGGIGSSDEAPDEADQVDVAVVVGDVDRGAQHQRAERDAAPPAPEGEHEEDDKDEEDDASDILLPVEHVDGRDQAPDDVEDAREPDDLLRYDADEEDVAGTEDKGDEEAEEEQDQGVCVDGEDGRVVDVCAISTSSRGCSERPWSARDQRSKGDMMPEEGCLP